MELSLIEMLQAVFATIFIVISLIVGLLLISKYFKYNQRNFALAGVTWIGIATPWLSGTISFPLMILFDTSLSVSVRFIIGVAFVPIVLVIWLIVFTDLVYKEKQKYIIIIYAIICVIFEIVFFTFLFIDTALIGTYTGPFKVDWTPFVRLTTLFFISTALITGIIFSLESMKSTNPEIKLKGKILLIAFISFVGGALLDSVVAVTPLAVIFIRLLLISSAIEFYFGFFLPEAIKKRLLKE